MRALLSVSESERRQAASDAMDVDDEPFWKTWLVQLGSRHAKAMFGKPKKTKGYYKVKRPKNLPGLCLLDGRRESKIRLRTLEGFRRQWSVMTEGVLNGLDWSNVFVGGGIVMGVLTGSFDEQSIASYKDSDIE